VAPQLFWVFARRTPTDPLEQIGVVKAETEALAYLYAKMNYTERPWRDLCVVPQTAVHGAAQELK
jgi:1,2-phenylacetyl-CoA epoxidase PaaB subunit